MEYVHLSFSLKPCCSCRTECVDCSKMFARNSSSRAGLTGFTPDTVDTANQLIPTSAVRKYEPRSLLSLTNILLQCADLARQED